MKHLKNFRNYQLLNESSSLDLGNIKKEDFEKILNVVDSKISELPQSEILKIKNDILKQTKKHGINLENERDLSSIISKVKVVADKNNSISNEIDSRMEESWRDFAIKIENIVKYFQMRLGMMSTIGSIVYTVYQQVSMQEFSWWQIFWIVISIIFWRLNTWGRKEQRKEREQADLPPVWYQEESPILKSKYLSI